MKVIILTLLALAIVNAQQHIRKRREDLAAASKTDSNFTIVENIFIGYGVPRQMLQYTQGLIVNVSNQLNLNGNNSMKVSDMIRRNLESKYNLSFRVFTTVKNKGDIYYVFDEGVTMSFLIYNSASNITNSTGLFDKFVVDVYLENLLIPKINTKPEFPIIAYDNLAATYIRTLSIGSGVTEQMRDFLISMIMQTADGRLLSNLNGTCFKCQETAQDIGINAAYVYKYGWSSSVTLYEGFNYYSGLSASSLNDLYLKIIIENLGAQFVVDIIATRPNF